jgi:hypothetical protein
LVETCGRTVFQNGSGFTWRAFMVMPRQPFFALRSLALRAASDLTLPIAAMGRRNNLAIRVSRHVKKGGQARHSQACRAKHLDHNPAPPH